MASEAFKSTSDRVVLESQQAMVAAIKEQRYEDALEYAEKVIAVQPENAMAQQFLNVLQEKVELDEIASGDEEGADEEGEEAADDEEGEDEDSDSDDDSADGADETAEASGDAEQTDSDEEEVQYPDMISMPPMELKLSSQERKAMKAKLSKQIHELKLEKENKKMADLNVSK